MSTRSLLYKYRYDLDLEDGSGTRLLKWVAGIMVFLMTLALTFNLALSGISQHWTSGIAGTLTVELAAPDEDTTSPDAQKILALLRRHPDIAKAELLAPEQVRKLVEPWLGDSASAKSLPLPRLIDVTLKSGRNLKPSALAPSLRAISPSAKVTDHTDWLGSLVSFGTALRLVAFLLALTVSLLAVVTIAGIIHARYDVHRPDVELLHLMGASDAYIARQFQNNALSSTLRGAALGTIAALVIALAFGRYMHSLDLVVLPQSGLSAGAWLMLALAPLAAGSLIALLTARFTLMRELLKMP